MLLKLHQSQNDLANIANNAEAIWVLKAFDPSEHIKLSQFLLMLISKLKQLK